MLVVACCCNVDVVLCSIRLTFRFTNRPLKSCANNKKLQFTPWLVHDVARGRYTYVYTPMKTLTKGANRWCTSMYWCIRALKYSGHTAASARHIVVIGK